MPRVLSLASGRRRRFDRLRPFACLKCLLALLLAVPAVCPAKAENNHAAKVEFDVPAGEAGPALKQFAQQAKREVMFAAQPVRGVTTKAVQGAYTVTEGLSRLLAGTELSGFIDEKTGAVVVQRSNDPNGQRAAQPASDRPKAQSDFILSKNP